MGRHQASKEELLSALDHSLHKTFRSDAWPLLSPAEQSSWGSYVAMQHYGHQTRLLDWTESFAYAVYFAQERKVNQEAAVWILSPEELNQQAHGIRALIGLDEPQPANGFPTDLWLPGRALERRSDSRSLSQQTVRDNRPIAAQPLLFNPRMSAQRSRFTVAGWDFDAIEDSFPRAVRKVILPPETYDDADIFLRLAGVNAYTLYPDHAGLALRQATESARQETAIEKQMMFMLQQQFMRVADHVSQVKLPTDKSES
ncbi:MAG: hypothetical protein AMXMBFR57_01460 [Acidimicrobiia bacterium]